MKGRYKYPCSLLIDPLTIYVSKIVIPTKNIRGLDHDRPIKIAGQSIWGVCKYQHYLEQGNLLKTQNISINVNKVNVISLNHSLEGEKKAFGQGSLILNLFFFLRSCVVFTTTYTKAMTLLILQTQKRSRRIFLFSKW